MALTAAPSPLLVARPIHRLAPVRRPRSPAPAHGEVAVRGLLGLSTSTDHSRRAWHRRCPEPVPGAAILEAVDRFVIQPNGPLAGTAHAGGAKNSALKLMAPACSPRAALLHNVPPSSTSTS